MCLLYDNKTCVYSVSKHTVTNGDAKETKALAKEVYLLLSYYVQTVLSRCPVRAISSWSSVLQETRVLREKPSDAARIWSQGAGGGGGEKILGGAQAILPCATWNNVKTYLDAHATHA